MNCISVLFFIMVYLSSFGQPRKIIFTMPENHFLLSAYNSNQVYLDFNQLNDPTAYIIDTIVKDTTFLGINNYWNTKIDSAKSGIAVVYNSKKKLEQIINLNNNKIDGFKYTFDRNRNVNYFASYKEGLLHGVEIFFRKPGVIWLSIMYSNGVFNGKVSKYFYKNGNLMNECEYIKGIKQGSDITYYRSGKMWMEVRYVNGLAEGEGHLFNKRGKLVEKRYYSNGNLTSKLQIN
jgi:antitoxin component YwqK of YwqJK toxin-antitoxin module